MASDFTHRPLAVVLAGGRGQRLRPLTDAVPKPLLRVGARTVIEHLLVRLARSGIRDVWLAVNYKARAFERRLGDGAACGVRLRWLREAEPLGTAGALALLRPPPRGPVLVTNADILTRLDYARLLEFHRRRGAAATVSVVPCTVRLPYGIVRARAGVLTAFEEKPSLALPSCNAGIYVLAPDVLRLVPRGVHFCMPELLERVRASGRTVRVFPIRERWIDIGSPEDLAEARREFAGGEE